MRTIIFALIVLCLPVAAYADTWTVYNGDGTVSTITDRSASSVLMN